MCPGVHVYAAVGASYWLHVVAVPDIVTQVPFAGAAFAELLLTPLLLVLLLHVEELCSSAITTASCPVM
jgi:hypothetical protein